MNVLNLFKSFTGSGGISARVHIAAYDAKQGLVFIDEICVGNVAAMGIGVTVIIHGGDRGEVAGKLITHCDKDTALAGSEAVASKIFEAAVLKVHFNVSAIGVG